jgi:tetratricopeptide (TPR) repeat protein
VTDVTPLPRRREERTARACFASSAIITLALLVTGARPAAAQPPPPGAQTAASEATRRAAARKLAQRATRKYNLGQFRHALDGYTRAYDTFPAPGLLFNIAQCHRGLGDHERAIRSFEAYLRERPNATNRGVVEELIAEEEALLRTQRQAAAAEAERARAAHAERQRAEEQRRAREERDRAARARPSPLLVAPKPVEEDPRGGTVLTRWWFWTAVGVAAVAAGGAIYLDAQRERVLPAGTLGTHDQRQ